jgi:integrase
VTAFENHEFVQSQKLAVGEYLTEHWLPMLVDRIKPTTLDSYERMVRCYVLPRIGVVKLQALSVGHLNRLYADLRQSGGTQFAKAKRGQPKGLSQKTVRNVHAMLSKALNDAVDSGLLAVNVAARAKPPKVRGTSQPIEAWTADELRQFLEYVAEDRLYACWHLAAHTGMRRGELLGLRWRDVDLAAGQLAIVQTLTLVYTKPTFTTPKSGEARVVDLDRQTMAVLEAHRRRQHDAQTEWGDGYVESGLVFRREDGGPINPDRLSQLFDKFVRHSGIRRIKLHGLRHTHATLMLKAGVPVKVVSERLGHADPAFTLRVYQHVLSGMQAEAANIFANVIGTRHDVVRLSAHSTRGTPDP